MSKPLEGLHCVAYARVSTKDTGQNPQVQIEAIRKWAKDNGVIIDAEFSEMVSGTVFPREKLSLALVTLATSTTASFLVCYDQSRLTRSYEEHFPLIKQMLNGKPVRYVVHGTEDNNSLGVRMLNAVKAVTDNEELRVLREKTRLGIKYAQEHGKHCGRPSAFVICDNKDSLPTGFITDKSVVISTADALRYGDMGFSPYRISKIVRCAPNTVVNAYKHAGLYEEYTKRVQKFKYPSENE